MCVFSPDLSKSHTKVLESLEFIPQYGEPVTTANYDNIRRYLTKVWAFSLFILLSSSDSPSWALDLCSSPRAAIGRTSPCVTLKCLVCGRDRHARPPTTLWDGWWRLWWLRTGWRTSAWDQTGGCLRRLSRSSRPTSHTSTASSGWVLFTSADFYELRSSDRPICLADINRVFFFIYTLVEPLSCVLLILSNGSVNDKSSIFVLTVLYIKYLVVVFFICLTLVFDFNTKMIFKGLLNSVFENRLGSEMLCSLCCY